MFLNTNYYNIKYDIVYLSQLLLQELAATDQYGINKMKTNTSKDHKQQVEKQAQLMINCILFAIIPTVAYLMVNYFINSGRV